MRISATQSERHWCAFLEEEAIYQFTTLLQFYTDAPFLITLLQPQLCLIHNINNTAETPTTAVRRQRQEELAVLYVFRS